MLLLVRMKDLDEAIRSMPGVGILGVELLNSCFEMGDFAI